MRYSRPEAVNDGGGEAGWEGDQDRPLEAHQRVGELETVDSEEQQRRDRQRQAVGAEDPLPEDFEVRRRSPVVQAEDEQ